MSLVGKNRKVFSYNNEDRNNSNFMYKNFEKANSYHSSFQKANFNYATFRAAKMKYCNFSQSSFVGTEFIGSNLRGSNFDGATFKDAIFTSAVLDKTSFVNASFENCFFLGTKASNVKGLDPKCPGISFLKTYPAQENFSEELLYIVELLRDNDIIRRSHTLHLKEGKINTLTLLVLKQSFSEEELIKYLPLVPKHLTSDFYTASYLVKLLKKISISV